jgi:chromosomal replication initiation ATPase DnaA
MSPVDPIIQPYQTSLTVNPKYIYNEKQKAKMILKLVARNNEHKVTVNEMLSHRRLGVVVAARHLAMWLMCTHTKLSLPAIGRELGGRDHTTIVHGRDKIKSMLSCPEMKELIDLHEMQIKLLFP